jgi:hypothetical protein
MMSLLILVIVAHILYLMSGTIFGILLTLLRTGNLKLKIILLTFLRPTLYTFLLSLLLPSLFDRSWVWLAGLAFAVVLRDLVFSNHKFLVNLTVHNDNLSVAYTNTFLQKKFIEMAPDHTKVFQLSDMKSIADYPASLKIWDSDNLQKFIILNREIWEFANTNLDAVNIRFAARQAVTKNSTNDHC